MSFPIIDRITVGRWVDTLIVFCLVKRTRKLAVTGNSALTFHQNLNGGLPSKVHEVLHVTENQTAFYVRDIKNMSSSINLCQQFVC